MLLHESESLRISRMYDFGVLWVYVSVQLELAKLGIRTLVVDCAGRIWAARWAVACANTKLHFG